MRATAVLLCVAAIVAGFAHPLHGQSACTASKVLCALTERVYPISSFEDVASAVLIEPGLLVTNRHAVADNRRAQVSVSGGFQILADVVPTSYLGDLILLRAPELTMAGKFEIAEATPTDALHTIGADVGRGQVRVYASGRVIFLPAKGKPLARLHHTAISQPGNSGGALVNGSGQLVAIVTSGGDGRFEAVPASEIATLRQLSGPKHLFESDRIGQAYKKCVEALDAVSSTRQRLDDSHVSFLVKQCGDSENRQMIDLAGQTLGSQRHFDQSALMFERALTQDPNAINSRLSLAITLHMARRYADEIPHLKQLIEVLQTDTQVLRLAIQAGKWGGNDAFAETAFTLLKAHHPSLAARAKRFMEMPPPPASP